MTHEKMLGLVRAQLAVDLNCTAGDLNGEADSVIFVEAKDNPGRRPFPRRERFFEIVSMGKSVVVCATPERLAIAQAQMKGKDRDTIFSLPFIRGLYLHHLPDLETLRPLSPPEGFTFAVVENGEAITLPAIPGFNHAIIYDRRHPYQTEEAVLAILDGEVVGVAGACRPAGRLCQIGVEVSPLHRNQGLAAYLVNRLTFNILEREHVPSYSAIASNLASQRVARRAGYFVAWVSDWRCNFEGLETPTA